jgi:DNA polymerase I-like protein with 3'-5' exonuclease and polymerase domains
MDKFIYIDGEWNKHTQLLCITWLLDDSNYGVILGNDVNLIPFLQKYIDEGYTFVGHNIKSDVLVIYENTGILLTKTFDTMIATQQLYNGHTITGKKKKSIPQWEQDYEDEDEIPQGKKEKPIGFYTYANIVDRICGVKLSKDLQTTWLDKFDYELTEEEKEYCLNDVKYLPKIREVLSKSIEKCGLSKSFEIDMKVLPVLTKIESKGMLIDVPKWRELVVKWQERLDTITQKLFTILDSLGYGYKTIEVRGIKNPVEVTVYINFNSSQQVKAIFNHFGVALPIDSKTGKDSTNQGLLATMNIQNPDNILSEFIVKFIELKKTAKLISSFGTKLLDNLRNGKTLHTEYSIAFTATGRLSSKGNKIRPYTTNVQNIPAKTKDGKDIMECVIAPDGYNVVSVDLSGAELRLAGSLSQDPLVLDSFNKGIDFHSALASASWEAICKWKGIEYEPISKKNNPKWQDGDFRTIHKGVNFGILYGATAKRVSEVLQIPNSVATEAYNAIKATIPKLMQYLKDTQDKAKKEGKITSPYTGRYAFNVGATQASNWQMQASNGEIMKLALIELDAYITTNNLDAWIVNTVHDSAVLYVKEDIDPIFAKDIMAKNLGAFLTGLNGESDMAIDVCWRK